MRKPLVFPSTPWDSVVEWCRENPTKALIRARPPQVGWFGNIHMWNKSGSYRQIFKPSQYRIAFGKELPPPTPEEVAECARLGMQFIIEDFKRGPTHLSLFPE